MPLYEYRCQECENKFELLRARGAASAVTCPACGTGSVQQLMSTFSGRIGTSLRERRSVAGSNGCGGCRTSSCASCQR